MCTMNALVSRLASNKYSLHRAKEQTCKNLAYIRSVGLGLVSSCFDGVYYAYFNIPIVPLVRTQMVLCPTLQAKRFDDQGP